MSCLSGNTQKKSVKKKKVRAPLVTTDADTSLIAILGFSGVGRTSLIARIRDDEFAGHTQLSHETEVSPVLTRDAASDSEEAQRYQLISPLLKLDSNLSEFDWFNQLAGVLLCFDVTDSESFSDLEVSHWWEELRQRQNLPVLLLGLHSDEEDIREVPKEAARKWASSRFLQYFECSAKASTNICNSLDAMFVLIRRARSGMPLRTRQRALSMSISDSIVNHSSHVSE
eukprot:TRINITY_DN449_c1_g1_i1.p1 TRINITY_DN449_c1_g1~~TRINITY_DN449_c1_g1_i1.p1  ORF type:complete len:228 (-),score=38.54 TRINITY_DN449_c1_g1_i1:175-858(-)